MKTMTIRNIPDDVAGQLKFLAETSNASINTTVVRLISGSVFPQKRRRRKRRDLSRFCGGWTQNDFNEFERATADCERVNPEDWK